MPDPPVPQSRCPRRRLPPGGPRPSSLLAAFFAAGLISLLAGAAVAIVHAVDGGYWSHWVSLHLLFLGGVSQLVLGAGQFFVCAFLATDPPGERMVSAQLVAWNAGTVLVAAGVPGSRTALTDAGGALIIAGLVLFVVSMVRMERRSLQQARWAVRWYEASASALAVGAVLGVLMAHGTTWTHGSLVGAHLALNLGGWFGTAIVGTMHTFFPSLTQTRLAHPRAQGATFALWTIGIAVVALGAAWDTRALLAVGWIGLLGAGLLLGGNVAASLRVAPRPLALAARLLAAAHGFLPAGLLLALVATVADGPSGPFTGAARPALAALLVAGWVGLTVAGSLMHLLAVLGRVRDLRRPLPLPHPRRDRALTTAAAVGVAGAALSRLDALGWLSTPATAVLLATGVVVGSRVISLAVRALISGRPWTSPRR